MKIAFEGDGVIVFDGKKYQIQNATEVELKMLRDEIAASVNDVCAQISLSRSNYHITGESRPREWYMAATAFKRHAMNALAKVKIEHKRRLIENEEKRKAEKSSFYREFVLCAKNRLPENIFNALESEAQAAVETWSAND